jgi:glucosamine-6-phosphate deaminase
MKVIETKNYEELSDKACNYMLERLQDKRNPVLGLATGSTPEGLYAKLIDKYNNNEISFKNTTTFNLDEYAGLPPENVGSYHYYMYDKLFNHIDIQKDNVYLLNGTATDLHKECTDYEALIQDKGPIDIQVLGIGENGHIGFNEPGTQFSSRTHLIDLKESTIQANARFFNSIEDVPKQAVTMGIGTIMESKAILLMAAGERKADALARLIEGEIHEESPASILQKHCDVTVIADEAALMKVKNRSQTVVKEKLPL